MSVAIGVDVGTTAAPAVAVDEDGRLVATASFEYPWLRLQADVYGLPVHRLEIEEGAAYGAALLGHVVAGTFADVNEAASVVRTKPEVTEPDPRTAETYDALHGLYRSVYASLREDMHRLAAFAGP